MDATLTADGYQIIDGNLDPKRGYEMNDSDTAANLKYYGYLNASGRWIIMKNDRAAETYRFITGKSGYTTAWANRASLSYDYLNIAYRNITG